MATKNVFDDEIDDVTDPDAIDTAWEDDDDGVDLSNVDPDAAMPVYPAKMYDVIVTAVTSDTTNNGNKRFTFKGKAGKQRNGMEPTFFRNIVLGNDVGNQQLRKTIDAFFPEFDYTQRVTAERLNELFVDRPARMKVEVNNYVDSTTGAKKRNNRATALLPRETSSVDFLDD